jgi:hypothetical protein
VTATTAPRPAAPHRPGEGRVARLFAYISFAIMAGGWVAFLIALVGSQRTLDDAWTAVRDLPLALEAPAWLLGFPFLLGLAVWHAPWDQWLRLALIGVVAVGYTPIFLPRRRS